LLSVRRQEEIEVEHYKPVSVVKADGAMQAPNTQTVDREYPLREDCALGLSGFRIMTSTFVEDGGHKMLTIPPGRADKKECIVKYRIIVNRSSIRLVDDNGMLCARDFSRSVLTLLFRITGHLTR